MSPNEANDLLWKRGSFSLLVQKLLSQEKMRSKEKGLTSQTGKEKQVVFIAFALRQRSMQKHRTWRTGFQTSVFQCVFSDV